MIGSGIDIIAIERVQKSIEKTGRAFLERVYTENEIEYCESRKVNAMQSFAGRFAAKEAVAKALGTGIGTKGVSFSDMEILSDEYGMPCVSLTGKTLQVYKEKKGRSISVSVSHDGGFAIAVCHIEYEDNER